LASRRRSHSYPGDGFWYRGEYLKYDDWTGEFYGASSGNNYGGAGAYAFGGGYYYNGIPISQGHYQGITSGTWYPVGYRTEMLMPDGSTFYGPNTIRYWAVNYSVAPVASHTSNSRDELEHANYWLGLSSTLLAGRQGFGYAINEFNTLQRTSNTLNLSLNYTKELSRGKTVIRGLKVGGVLTSGVSLAFAYNDWRAGNISNSKFAFDAGMTLYTHIPVVGWAAGLQYYIIDSFYPGGFPGFSQDYVNQQMEFHNAIGYSMRSFMH